MCVCVCVCVCGLREGLKVLHRTADAIYGPKMLIRFVLMLLAVCFSTATVVKQIQ